MLHVDQDLEVFFLFSVKGQIVNILDIQATVSLLQLLDFAMVTRKQPEPMCKQMGISVVL